MPNVLRWDRSVLRFGLACGLLLGATHVVYNLVNNLANPNLTLNAVLNNGLTLAIVGLSGTAGFLSAWRTRRVRAGMQAGLVAAVVSTVIGITTLWVVTLIFMDTIRHNTFMVDDFVRSGMQSMDAFIIDDALGATFFGGTLALLVGIGVGTLGGLLGKTLHRMVSDTR